MVIRATLKLLVPVLALVICGGAAAEARRDAGGDDAMRKAQYMLRQLSQEKSELQVKVSELQALLDETQGKLEKVTEKQEAAEASLSKSRATNSQLTDRIHSDVEKYKELLERYRETVATLNQANADNRYLVKAVQEREQWINVCRERNDGLFEANSDLLQKYKSVAIRGSEPVTGIGRVTVENEAQEYRFKLEDLQVTRFESSVDIPSHTRSDTEVVAREDSATEMKAP